MDNPTPSSNSKFRFQGIKMFVTIPGHHSDELISHIHRCVNVGVKTRIDIADWILGREVGKDGYQHTHVAIKFSRKICFQDCRKLDLGELHPSIEPVRNWDDAVHYVAKNGDYEGTVDLDSCVPIQTKIDKVYEAKTMRDALKQAYRINEVMPMIKIFEVKGKSNESAFKPLEELREWQALALKTFEEDHSDRHVYWIVDEEGGSGKTALQKHMRALDSTICMIPNATTGENINRVIANFVKNGPISAVLINLPRGVMNFNTIFDTIEQCKDGCILSAKYDSNTIELEKSIKVWVFSNKMPQPEDLVRLTSDRWRIMRIINGQLVAGRG